MKLSSQEEYGLRCLLTVARLDGADPVPITEVAAREGLSTDYAAKLLRILRQKDLLISVRGAQGGYRLARPASEITVHHALVALDGQLYDSAFCDSHTGRELSCVHSTKCSIRGLWLWIGSALEHALNGVTLADLVRGEPFVGSALPTLPDAKATEVTL